MKKKTSNFISVLLGIVLLAGLSLLLYPSVSNYWNSFHQSQAIASYSQKVAEIDDKTYEKLIADAVAYNKALAKKSARYNIIEAERRKLQKLLNVGGNGVIGYIEIPTIRCSLPLYHGTSHAVLQIAVGHIEGTSLPVGGETTHCAISGHRGLPSAKLLTDLDKLEIGDYFVIRVLDEILTYEVDKISIVLPNELGDLKIEKGKDYFTLVTCTPYGINSHRLLVRGYRVENRPDASSIRITADATKIDPLIVAPIVATPLLLTLLILLLIPKKKKKIGGDVDEIEII